MRYKRKYRPLTTWCQNQSHIFRKDSSAFKLYLYIQPSVTGSIAHHDRQISFFFARPTRENVRLRWKSRRELSYRGDRSRGKDKAWLRRKAEGALPTILVASRHILHMLDPHNSPMSVSLANIPYDYISKKQSINTPKKKERHSES